MLDLWILTNSQHPGYCGDIDSYCHLLDPNKFEPRSAFDSNIMVMKHRLRFCHGQICIYIAKEKFTLDGHFIEHT